MCISDNRRLYDNPQIAQTYLDAFRLTGKQQYARTARDILDYLMRDMRHPQGGFFSAEVGTWQAESAADHQASTSCAHKLTPLPALADGSLLASSGV